MAEESFPTPAKGLERNEVIGRLRCKGMGSRKFIFNKMGEVTTCLCVCGSDLIEGQSAYVRVRGEEPDRYS